MRQETAGATQSPPVAPYRRGRLWPTLEGFGWLAISTLLLYQGWLRGINLVALLATFLLSLWFLNLVWVARRWGLKKLQIHRHVDERVFARDPFMLTLEAYNPCWHNQRAVRIQDAGPHHKLGWVLPVLGRRQHRSETFQVTLPRRGRYVWPELFVISGHPFGLVRRTVRIFTGESILILPRLGRLHRGRLRRLLLEQPQINQSTKRPVMRHPGAQTEFYGLREFRTGDSPRWIHWRTSARVGELMVREFEEPPVDNLLVVVEAWLPQPLPDLVAALHKVQKENRELVQYLLSSGPTPPPSVREAKEAALAKKEEAHRLPLQRLELALSLAATACWEWCRQPGARVGLALADVTSHALAVDTGQRQAFPLLDVLALAQGSPTPDVQGMLDQMTGSAIPPGPVLLVTMRDSNLEQRLSERLRRPVFTLNVAQDLVKDLFQEELIGSRQPTPEKSAKKPAAPTRVEGKS